MSEAVTGRVFGVTLMVISAGLAIASNPAWAADKVTAAACIEANEAAGPLRHAGKLREARASLRLCSAESCPIVVRKDCLAGAAQIDADVPTITFLVHGPDGNDLTAVTVSLDGQPLVDRLDGKAVDVDPGEHSFRFEAAGLPPVEKRLVVTQGQKNRQEQVQLGELPKAVIAPVPVPPVAPGTESKPNTLRTAGLVTAGVGLGLVAAGAVSGLVAALEWSAAKSDCGAGFPQTCGNQNAANADRRATVAAGFVADIGLGVGAAALVTGAAMVLVAPPPGQDSKAARLRLAPLAGSANGFMLQGSF